MTKRLGLVQTRGIGDIIIALPIADHYIEEGWEVYWPIDSRFLEMFRRIKPAVHFLGVEVTHSSLDYFLNDPVRQLQEKACDKIVVLYSHLGGVNVVDLRLAASLTFDEYKYAIAGVPFEKKWELKYDRDIEREEALFQSLNIEGDYVCTHDRSTEMGAPVEIAPELTRGLQIVPITQLTDSIFDWRLTLERATKLILVNSCFANFVEQLNLENEKAVFLYSPTIYTPVFANNWRFLFPREVFYASAHS